MTAKSVILVHGAWADGSSWVRVIPSSRRRGWPSPPFKCRSRLCRGCCHSPRGPGSAEAPVVLVGHSYGGSVITEAGQDAKVSALVYIAAFAPAAQESAASLGKTVDPAPMNAELRPDASGFLKLTETGIRHHFAQIFATRSRRSCSQLKDQPPLRH